jgi:hypothetical protein
VLSCQQLLSLVFELKLAYSLYDFVSVSSQQHEIGQTLSGQVSANNATILKLSHEVNELLKKLEA